MKPVEKKDPVKYASLNQEFNSFVNSVNAVYSTKFEKNVLDFSNLFNDTILIYHLIRKGMPYGLFEQLKLMCPFKETDWANYLNISIKTLQRHKKEANYVFKPIHTEKIIEITEVNQLGIEVFDTKKQFYSWLNSSSYALGNLKPLELLKDSYGKELVMSELNRIEHGIFA